MKNLPNLFKNKNLLDTALTHRSWVNEHKNIRPSNERLEFLGDAVLEFIVSKKLYLSFPNREEGYLTALRANLVNTNSLAALAQKLGLGDAIYLSRGEEDSGGRVNMSLLANTVEAIIGALFIDKGLEASENFLNENLLDNLMERAELPLKDPKSLLQEHVQSQGFPAPRYKVIEEAGPDHSKKFVIEAMVNGKPWGRGEGKSKAMAEQEAAKNALNVIQSPNGEN